MKQGKRMNRREVLQAGAACALAGSLSHAALAAGSEDSSAESIKVAVITGRHGYDVPNFHTLFRSMSGVDAYIQHMEDFVTSPEPARQSYDALVFYFMPRKGPEAKDLTAYEKRLIGILEHVGESKQGIVVLHHALLGYRAWPVWSEVVGIDDRKFGYHPGQTLKIDIAAADHPITAGLQPWEMSDETYTMDNASEGSTILLTTDHPKSMKTIGWTRKHKNARVFCLASGHDNVTWVDANFREVLGRGIRWCAAE